MDTFKYLGRIMSSDDSNCTSVDWNLHRVQSKWGRLSHLFGHEGAENRTSVRFYVSVVQSVLYLFQTKKSTFSTCALILVHYKLVHSFSQPIFSLFSHLNSALHNLIIDLCSALKTIHLFISLI